MNPRDYFDEVWTRADLFEGLYAYMNNNTVAALQPDELLRAEWAMRVSALDLFVHEVVAQNLLKIFQGVRPVCPGYSKLQISSDTLMRIHGSGQGPASDTAFDLEVRTQLGRVTYQFPDDIADGIRLVSPVKLWNEVAINLGANVVSATVATATLKQKLSIIVNRRNKIVHEGDLQPTIPRTPWPISRSDVDDVKATIQSIVVAIDAVIG